jgi:hypothetical protein
MNDRGKDVRDMFPAGPDDAPPETGLLRGVREQDAAARRARAGGRMRALAATGVVAAVAAAGVTAALLAQSATGAPSPLSVVTSALAKTSADSYSFSLDSTVQMAGRYVHSDVVTGAFDPRRELGAEVLTSHGVGVHPGKAQIRFIGRYLYTWVSPGSGLGTVGKPWNMSPDPPAGANEIPEDDPYGFVSDRPVSPAALSVVLRSAGTVSDGRPASGPGWTGTKYTFTARLFDARESISGTLYVDQQGRVRRLVTITTEEGLTTDRDLTFGHFGAPVPVTAPTVSQVKYTSKPYWGFYF